MVSLALSVNVRAAEYCRAQNRGLPSVAKAFGALMSTDALRNPISIERLQGPIVMITAGKAAVKYNLKPSFLADCRIGVRTFNLTVRLPLGSPAR